MQDSLAIHSFTFYDFDLFAQRIGQADIVHQQLSTGRFSGSLRQLYGEHLILSLHEMNQLILQEGAAIDGYITFLIPGNIQQDFAWRCNQLKGDVIGILQGGMDHHCITHPNFFGMPVSVESNFISELAEALGFENFFKTISNKECFLVDIRELNVIRTQIHDIFQNPSQMDDFCEEEMALSLIRLFSERKDFKPRSAGITRRRIYQKAVQFMSERVMDPISVPHIAQAVGVSERNLRYAFHEVAKISPKRFLDRLRLNHVRKFLRSGKFYNVIDVSQAFGYWHSGKFASDYKSLFYEYPSESINRNS